MAEHKGFEASKKKLDAARRKGQILHSPFIIQVLGFVCVLAIVLVTAQSNLLRSKMLLDLRVNAEVNPAVELMRVVPVLFIAVGLPLIFGALIAIGAGLLQSGGVKVEFGNLFPQEGKFNFVNGITKIISGLKSSPWLFLKLMLVGGMLLYFFAPTLWDDHLLVTDGRMFVACTSHLILKVFAVGSCGLLILGCAEYQWQKRQFGARMSMSQDELRREHKEDEGDPMLKAVRHHLHESISMEEIHTQIRNAKCVVVERM